MNNFIHRFFNRNHTEKQRPAPDTVTPIELKQFMLQSVNRIRGLKSATKHYSAMIDYVEKGRKRHYSHLKDEAQHLLSVEEKELATLQVAWQKMST